MASLREQLNQENETKKMQAGRTATDGSIIVDEYYTLQDLEEYVVNKIHERKLDFLKKNHDRLVSLILETEDSCYDTKIPADRLFLTIYLNYYFNNIEPYIFCDKLSDFFNYFELRQLCKYDTEFVLIKPPVQLKYRYIEDENTIICKKNNEDIFCTKYENSIVDKNILEKIAVKLFEKPVKTLRNFLNGKQITNLQHSLSVSVSMYVEANRINQYKQIHSLLKDELRNFSSKEKLTNIILVPTSSDPELILTRANFMCILSIHEKNGFLSIGYIKYAVLSKDDKVELQTGEDTKVSMDATISPVYTKKTSVVGSALIGTAVAGVAGGCLGTLLATEKNRNRQEQIDSYKPLMVDIKLPKLDITISLKRMKESLFLHVNKALYDNTEIEQFLSVISEAKTERACFEGELIKEFILDSDSKECYSEEKFKVYAKQTKESITREALKKDNRLIVIADKEAEIQNKIRDAEINCDKQISNSKQYYDEKINECKEQATNIKNKMDSLSIFKMKEKKVLKGELQEVEEKMNKLQKSCEQAIANTKERFRKERENFESQKVELERTKDMLLYYLAVLGAQNRIY